MLDKQIIVQKYGGTSVKDAQHIKNVAKRIVAAKKKGKQVVVVVSAPGDTTNKLLDLAYSITDSPDERELDVLLSIGEQQSISLLAMAIQSLGFPAKSFTGPQVGILTDSVYNMARIKSIETEVINQALKEDNVVIVAGFQGTAENSDITTLGRGGSDLSAVALAAVLKAEVCEIYTDVEGVFTTDPSIVPTARKIDFINYDEMLELASAGAKVMQSRSMEVAKKMGVVIHIKSSLMEDKEGAGTKVMKDTKDLEQVVVRGVTLDADQVKISIVGVPDEPGVAAQIFRRLADSNINVDMIIQSSAYQRGINDISFTITEKNIKSVEEIMDNIKKEIGFNEVIIDRDVEKVSIVGIGMKSHAGVAAEMFEVLSSKGINIEMISTSEIKISCVVSNKKGKEALKALHEKFCE